MIRLWCNGPLATDGPRSVYIDCRRLKIPHRSDWSNNHIRPCRPKDMPAQRYPSMRELEHFRKTNICTTMGYEKSHLQFTSVWHWYSPVPLSCQHTEKSWRGAAVSCRRTSWLQPRTDTKPRRGPLQSPAIFRFVYTWQRIACLSIRPNLHRLNL